MARAYASTIIKAPIESVWGVVRNFNGLPTWAPNVVDSKIEKGLDADVVGCIRSFHTKDGTHVRERLLSLDDARTTFSYNFEKPAFPIKNYLATIRLMPVTHDDSTFAEWEAVFDEAPADEGVYSRKISAEVFARGLRSLGAKVRREKLVKPGAGERWKGGQPNKIWTSRIIAGPVDEVWAIMRDFAGMAAWHGEITRMHMVNRKRSDKVSAVRKFDFGGDLIEEQLLHLCDISRSFSYRITKSDIKWLNYVSGPRLWPVTSNNTTFGVWTGDWVASSQEDRVLVPRTEQNVYQRAFATLEKNFFSRKRK